jgi:prefoldin subunit 5
MQFYQSQTNELESRIESLLKVNSTLKERLESLLRGEGKNSAMMFYKEQLAMSEETADNLNTKLKKLLDENRSLKHNSSETTTKMCREY